MTRELNEEELVREAVTGEVIDSDYTWEEIEEPILVLDTPDEIEMYRILAIRKALQLEVTTGMKFSKGNHALHRARELLGNPKLNKKQALKEMNELLEL
tara:strand:- start:277 stop:573 length:297 start_codon:yes stop_codon:yes gene_type:complete